MSEIRANAYFTFTGKKIKIQCTADETMESICKKFSNKIPKEMNSLLFLYEEKQVNFELKFREQANEKDLKENAMNILVLKKEEFMCPKCKEKEKLNSQKLDEIIASNNEAIEYINTIRSNIDNIIESNKANPINSQLELINITLKNINQNIKNNGKNVNNLFSDYNNNNINKDKNNINNDKDNINKEKNTNFNEELKSKFNITLENHIFYSKKYIIYEKNGIGKEFSGFDDTLLYEGGF